MPVSRMPASQPTNPASPPDSTQAPTSPPVSSSGGAVLSRLAAAKGPKNAASEMICVVTTTIGGQSQRGSGVGPNVEGRAVEDVAQAQWSQRDDPRRPRSADRWLRSAVWRRWSVAGLPAVNRWRRGTRCGGPAADKPDRPDRPGRRGNGGVSGEDRSRSAGNRCMDSRAAARSPGWSRRREAPALSLARMAPYCRAPGLFLNVPRSGA